MKVLLELDIGIIDKIETDIGKKGNINDFLIKLFKSLKHENKELFKQLLLQEENISKLLLIIILNITVGKGMFNYNELNKINKSILDRREEIKDNILKYRDLNCIWCYVEYIIKNLYTLDEKFKQEIFNNKSIKKLIHIVIIKYISNYSSNIPISNIFDDLYKLKDKHNNNYLDMLERQLELPNVYGLSDEEIKIFKEKYTEYKNQVPKMVKENQQIFNDKYNYLDRVLNIYKRVINNAIEKHNKIKIGQTHRNNIIERINLGMKIDSDIKSFKERYEIEESSNAIPNYIKDLNQELNKKNEKMFITITEYFETFGTSEHLLKSITLEKSYLRKNEHVFEDYLLDNYDEKKKLGKIRYQNKSVYLIIDHEIKQYLIKGNDFRNTKAYVFTYNRNDLHDEAFYKIIDFNNINILEKQLSDMFDEIFTFLNIDFTKQSKN